MEDPQRQNPAERGAPTKEAGGAEYAVREAMLELESHEADAGPQGPGAVTKLTVEPTAFQILSFVATHAVRESPLKALLRHPLKQTQPYCQGANPVW